ncbi:glycosyltransferase [Aurantiacibacter suaedae]|uniref:glycosyltransferase n=1 Tax=Aurantiacibacter suaedae TaxID=2545755 RepID=UPI0010F74BBE|nr:glycosyltransferase [Aurantiacibacter suaedae]
MKILFINTHYYMPQSVGGMSVTLHQLCSALIERGHEVSVLAGFRKGALFGLRSSIAMKLRALAGRSKLTFDRVPGYRVWRSWHPVAAIPEVCDAEMPDIVIVMGGKVVPAAKAAKGTGLPVLVQVHDVELEFHDGDYGEIADLPVIANSQFTASFYRDTFGAAPSVIYPYIRRERYLVKQTGQSVAFINPYVHKGLLVAIAVARRCAEIPFIFVGNVPEGGDELGTWADQLAGLPNVRCLAPVSDMRAIYAQTRILFAPSQWQEAFGRVAAEAQVSGIPVVGSGQGGLPEAIGGGGIVLPADAPIDAWAEALRRLWNDEHLFRELQRTALAEAQQRSEGLEELEVAMNRLVSEGSSSQRRGGVGHEQ